MKIYEDDRKIREWDFNKNINIDIVEEEDTSEEIAYWICEDCKTEYTEAVEKHSTTVYSCPKCKHKLLYDINKKQYEFLYFMKNMLPQLVLIAIVEFFFNAITIEKISINEQSIVTSVFHVIVYGGILLLLHNFFVRKVNKDFPLKKIRTITYEIINENIGKLVDIKNFIHITLLHMIRHRLKEKDLSNEDIAYEINNHSDTILTHYAKQIGNDNYKVYSNYKNLFHNDCFYYSILSQYETKGLIDFSTDLIYKDVTSLLITITGIFLSIMSYITNWAEFGLKSLLTMLTIIILIFALYIPNYKSKIKQLRKGYMQQLIIISSSVTKYLKEKASK